MANPSIGAYSFVTKTGPDPVSPAMVIEEITRDGVDSQAYRQKAKRGPVVTWVTEVDTSTPAALFASHQALQGTIASVIGDDGASFPSVAVLRVQRLRVKKTILAAGGVEPNGSWILTEQWVLQGT